MSNKLNQISNFSCNFMKWNMFYFFSLPCIFHFFTVWIRSKWTQKTAKYYWATSWENLFMPYANDKGADQPAHPRSLISAFVVCCLDSTIPLLAISEISRLQLASIVEQTGLSLTWSQTPKTSFLMTRLIWLLTRTNVKKPLYACDSQVVYFRDPQPPLQLLAWLGLKWVTNLDRL